MFIWIYYTVQKFDNVFSLPDDLIAINNDERFENPSKSELRKGENITFWSIIYRSGYRDFELKSLR